MISAEFFVLISFYTLAGRFAISSIFEHELPAHGGDLIAASRCFGVNLEDWIDLSTGVNPQSYPVPAIEPQFFSALPYVQPEFIKAAQHYYQQDNFIAVAGSQSAIQALPLALERGYGDDVDRVLVPSIGYREHEKSWSSAGYNTVTYDSLSQAGMLVDINQQLDQCAKSHLVIINPNNPSGVFIDPSQLICWAEALEDGGQLIVDEAFIDLYLGSSLLSQDNLPDNIIILRSFGKFFGLAGLRLGFVFAHQSLLNTLSTILGLWQVNGPAQAIAQIALRDTSWQARAGEEIIVNQRITEEAFHAVLSSFQVVSCVQRGLFTSYTMPADQALVLYRHLAKSGILVRFVPVSKALAILRMGVVSRLDEAIIHRLQCRLALCAKQKQSA